MDEILRTLIYIYAIVVNIFLVGYIIKLVLVKYIDKFKIINLSKKNGVPDYILKLNPESVIKKYGIKIFRLWLKISEPKFIDFPSYPPDWYWRSYYIRLRDKNICQYCGQSSLINHVHHVVPISKGGSHIFSNLITLCSDCHQKEHPYKLLNRSYYRHITHK